MENKNPGITDPNYQPEGFSHPSFHSMAKDFIEPGDDVKKLIMRCRLLNERQKNAAVLYYRRCVEYDMKNHLDMFLTWLAASDSIGARRINLLAETYVGSSRRARGGGLFNRIAGIFSGDDKKSSSGDED